MKLPYYPGCSIHGSSKEYEMSAFRVLGDLGVELEEVKDWNCCGAFEASAVDHFLSVALPARNLTLPLPAGSGKMVMLCSACQQVHRKAQMEMRENPALGREIAEIVGRPVNTEIDIEHLLYFVANGLDAEKVKEKVKVPLKGLKVAPYYGCAVDRPTKYIKGDDPNFPSSMEKIIGALGAEPVKFEHRTRCCGGTAMLADEEVSRSLTGAILREAVETGADCLAVVCPLCHVALEAAAMKAAGGNGSGDPVPVLYFTQLMGLAFGHGVKELGLNRHIISADKVLAKLGWPGGGG